MTQKKRCNFCEFAKPTKDTKYKDELNCKKRKKTVFIDDSCNFFKPRGYVPKIDGDQLFMIPKRRGSK